MADATVTAERILAAGGAVQCKVCFGDLMRYDGELRCGTCGWPLKEEPPEKNNAVPKSQLQLLQEKVAARETDKAKQAERIAELEKAAQRVPNRKEIRRG
jgi:uncharacterized Zn finger protein (UPF0148 family)